MPRPRVYTNEQMIRGLRETKGAVYLAAERIGCDADTIYKRAKISPAVAACLRHERGKVVDTAELKLHEAILAGAPWAIALTLKTLGKDRGYVERPPTALFGALHLENLSDEQLAQLEELVQLASGEDHGRAAAPPGRTHGTTVNGRGASGPGAPQCPDG